MCRGEGFNSSALLLQKEGAGIRDEWDMEMTAMTQVRGFHSRTDAAGEGKWDASGPSRPISCSLSCPVLPLCQCWAALGWVEAVGCPQPSLSTAARAVMAVVLSSPTRQGWPAGWGSVYGILVSSSRALSPALQDLPGQSHFTAVTCLIPSQHISSASDLKKEKVTLYLQMHVASFIFSSLLG